MNASGIIDHSARLLIPHVIKGETLIAAEVEHHSRATREVVMTPKLDLDALVWRRHEPGPAFEMPVAEIIDFLGAVGVELDYDRNTYLQEAMEQNVRMGTLSPRILENCYRDIAGFFTREAATAEAVGTFGSLEALDGWQRRKVLGAETDIRAFPPRIVHILAGNAPVVPPITIVRAALSKGVHLLKMPSNDLFTATALLRTMADVGPDHPVTRSFSAAYWRGGDESIESHIFRSQYYDKLAVWGGDAAVRHAMKYAAPGFEIISFDPKVSIGLIGREAHRDAETLASVAQRAAADILAFNQDACASARFQFVEGDDEQIDAFCRALQREMGNDTRYGDGPNGPIPPRDVVDELDMLDMLAPLYQVYGKPDGSGVVVRSGEPVGFSPSGKVVNVVQVGDLKDALPHVTVATQTVGVYPLSRSQGLRDALSAAGVQRIVRLGCHLDGTFGGQPHDGGWPLHRMMHWVACDAGD
ncbi:MAG: long-chain-fatty-acyl-CoA reductase [Sphingomonadales bacterium]|nr:long-chain-fatty-acyl-CoA reductase [Sphingomonadales bacterium]MDE2569469.1 long-chain-fatty-acyl-CoA reductase [Sphingomonadales bacterium]